ncbi:hypothetical protein ATR1_146d0001, partial [Acetobacter tropicalis]
MRFVTKPPRQAGLRAVSPPLTRKSHRRVVHRV